MDPLAVIINRLDQLEAKLGVFATNNQNDIQRGDSIAENLVNTAATIQNATANHDKLAEATNRACELNNYTDPNLVEKIQERELHAQEVAAAEPIIRHHHQCMHRCKQAAPVLESEAIAQVPKMQETVQNMHAAAMEVKEQVDNVSSGVQELAHTCGDAAASAAEKLAQVSQNVEQAEQRKYPVKRNGLD